MSESPALRGCALSKLRTVSPADRYAATRLVPMKPEPPVIRIRAAAGKLVKSGGAGLMGVAC